MESTLTFTLQEGGGSKKKKSCRLTDDFVTNHNNYDYLFKIVVVGGSTVGKSSILQRYADNKFSESQTSTLGVVTFFKKKQKIMLMNSFIGFQNCTIKSKESNI